MNTTLHSKWLVLLALAFDLATQHGAAAYKSLYELGVASQAYPATILGRSIRHACE